MYAHHSLIEEEPAAPLLVIGPTAVPGAAVYPAATLRQELESSMRNLRERPRPRETPRHQMIIGGRPMPSGQDPPACTSLTGVPVRLAPLRIVMPDGHLLVGGAYVEQSVMQLESVL